MGNQLIYSSHPPDLSPTDYFALMGKTFSKENQIQELVETIYTSKLAVFYSKAIEVSNHCKNSGELNKIYFLKNKFNKQERRLFMNRTSTLYKIRYFSHKISLLYISFFVCFLLFVRGTLSTRLLSKQREYMCH